MQKSSFNNNPVYFILGLIFVVWAIRFSMNADHQ